MNANRLTVLGLCGYDFRNVGDDAFMAVLGEQLVRARSAAEVRVTSSYVPAGCQSDHLLPIYRGLGRWRGASLLRLLKFGGNLDAVVLCGGSVLHEACHFERETLKLRALQARNPGLRTAALGVSIGPIQSAGQIRRLIRYLNRFDYVSVRDEPSWEFLCAQPLRCRTERHFDLAALLLREPQPTQRVRQACDDICGPMTIGLAPCHVQRFRGGDPALDDARCVKIAEALRRLARRQRLLVRFFEFNGHAIQGDRPAIEAICRGLDGLDAIEVIPYRPDPRYFLNEVGRCDAMIAMRLHSAVFAFLRKVALVSLAYHPKCTGFSRDIGLPADSILDADNFVPGDLVQAVEAALAGGGRGSLRVESAIASAQRHWAGALQTWAWAEDGLGPKKVGTQA